MSLTLEEVRRVRFRMARRGTTGYAVADVDNFIDKVEESFGQFETERDRMRRDLESAAKGAKGSDSNPAAAVSAPNTEELAAKDAEIANLKAEINRLNGVLAEASAAAGSSKLADEMQTQNDQLRRELDGVRTELDQVRSQRVSEVAGQAETITVTTREEASPAVIRLVQLATGQAEQLVAEAEVEAGRKLEDAKQQAFEITTDARTKADRIESEARVNAEQMTRDAKNVADRVTVEADQHRAKLFTDLEREQAELSVKVGSLRNFESSYRDNLRNYLTTHLGALDKDLPEPAGGELIAPANQADSDSPRLDALG